METTRNIPTTCSTCGYPACPNLEDQTKLSALLHLEENVGVKLTTGFLLEPEQSTSAIVVHHPGARYLWCEKLKG